MPHYLGKLVELQVKQTLYLTLLSMWVMPMQSIRALNAA
jgi:hypothetical protein